MSSTPSLSSALTVIAEPQLRPGVQDFSDLPLANIRKGIDDEGNPWTPDLILCPGTALAAISQPEAWAHQHFAAKFWNTDFSSSPDTLPAFPLLADTPPYWIIRLENQRALRKLLTVRLYIAPAGLEDEHLAWTPIDKFLVELEPKQQTAVIRQATLQPALDAWSQRPYFDNIELPRTGLTPPPDTTRAFIAVWITDAERDHPKNVCHCGSVSTCGATAQALDNRNPRYPYDKAFKHSIRTTIPMLAPVAIRLMELRP